MHSMRTELYWDPFDTEIDSDPYPIWRRMRDEAPVYRNERYDFWALSRFDDVEAAHKDTATFSSAHGTVLEIMSPELVGGEHSSIIFMDPPEHTQLRALVSRAFTPRRVSALEARIRELCEELFARVEGRHSFDFVQDFAARLPAEVIASLLGVPDSDREFARRNIDLVLHIEPGVGMINETSLRAQARVWEYLAAQLEERRRNPRDDMLTGLVEAEVTDEGGATRKLTQREATAFASLLISAGTETVARLLGNAAVVLAAHPDQRAELAADRTKIPNAVEELLRYEPPSPVQGRWTARDVELHGTWIPRGSKVLLLTGSAGRDERRFPEPDRFDVHRRIDHHLSFGYGVHFCLGAALARLEGRVGLEETLRRFPEWDVDLAHAKRLHTSTVRGWSEIPFSPVRPR
jgi:cytochrome P450